MKMKTVLAAVLLLALSGLAQADVVDKEFTVSPGQTLEVDLDTGGSVTIKGNSGSKVVVRARMTGRDASDIDLRVERMNNGVKIESEYKSSWRDRSGGVDLEVTVPSRFDLDIETLGGEISVDGVEGYLGGSTMGGQLDLRNLKGTVDMSTMGGNVRLVSSEVDGEVSTMGGRVELRDVMGNVKGKSMGGNVIYDNVRPAAGAAAKPVEISTMGGDIEVPSAPGGASVSTMGGDIEVESATKFVKAKTMGGDITIREVDGWVEATTMGGDIDVRVTGSEGDRHIDLSSKGGDVTVELPAGFSMTVDIEIEYSRRGRDDAEIVSDFPLKVEDEADKSEWGGAVGTVRGTGSVNGGRNKVTIRTLDGTVTLRRR
jgi:DUF4097 and DUF4098 domain-containing protein YvlB